MSKNIKKKIIDSDSDSSDYESDDIKDNSDIEETYESDIDDESISELDKDEEEEEEEEGDDDIDNINSDEEPIIKSNKKIKKKYIADDAVCPQLYKNHNSDSESDSDYEEIEDTEIQVTESTHMKDKIVKPEDRITRPFLTKYERVRLIGDRTKQLASGAKSMLKNIENYTSQEVATMELEHNVIPLIIERPLPNNKKERWHIRELMQNEKFN